MEQQESRRNWPGSITEIDRIMFLNFLFTRVPLRTASIVKKCNRRDKTSVRF